MGAPATSHLTPPEHSPAFRRRRFLNWFPLGLTYALLYMGRYNLTVAKNALGELMTKEDFGLIFGAGTITYAFSFLINGPLVDRIGGRRGILIGAAGSFVANAAMGLYLHHALASGTESLRVVFSVLYALNMYFQSYGAVSIVKVNAHWFHVGERGGFSGIFGTMISSGIFLAFTVNGWLLDRAASLLPDSEPASRTFVVFVVPAALLAAAFVVESLLLRDRPSEAGFEDFDTGDADRGDDTPIPTRALYRRILTNPILLTVAGIEFCTGIVRNGVMHWFPIYAKEIWVLPGNHPLRYGGDLPPWLVPLCVGVAIVSAWIARRATGRRRGLFVSLSGLAFLAPFVGAGWGGLLMVAGVIGGNVAGWISDLVFQSRRGPAVAGLYGLLIALSLGMVAALAVPQAVVASSEEGSPLRAGDEIRVIAGREVSDWPAVRDAVACWRPHCQESTWDEHECICRSDSSPTRAASLSASAAPEAPPIPAEILRDGETLTLAIPDPRPVHRAGDRRLLNARPRIPLSPFALGSLVFLISLCVIGTHGLLSGTATMDFGGRRGAATAVGVIDGFVYLGTAIQSVSLGYLTSRSWTYWPLFLLPFAVLGFLLSTRIWSARPRDE